MLNWGLIKNPYNWVVILLMLVFAGMAGHLILSMAGIEPATSNS